MTSRGQDGPPSNYDSNRIRVGHRYQAEVPEAPTYSSETRDMATLVWTANCNLTPEEIERYLIIAREQYHYNDEQALGMLTWHKFDIDRAVVDLANYSPFPDGWTVEDKVLFEQAFQLNVKVFHKIQQFLPDKSIGQLVNYYYKWKKNKERESELDRKQSGKSSGTSAAANANSSSSSSATANVNHRSGRDLSDSLMSSDSFSFHQNHNNNNNLITPRATNRCTSCYIFISNTPRGSAGGPGAGGGGGSSGPVPTMCRECLLLAKKIGCPEADLETAAKKPRGIHLDMEDLRALAAGMDIITPCDREIIRLRQEVQLGKQRLEVLRNTIADGISGFTIAETSARISSRWTNDEMLLAIQAFRSDGRFANFKSIADIIKTKNETHVREFYLSHKERFQLDNIEGFS